MRIKRAALGALCLLAAGAVGYAAYVLTAYDRLEDCLPLTVENGQQAPARAGERYTLLSYNVGFGAYSADYSFFMDGGKESRARSPEAVLENLGGALETVKARKPDFILLQEVDVDATRSHHVDETALAAEMLPDYGRIFAQNYDSPYLFWPLTEPHGASRAGMLTLTSCRADSSLRRSLPVERGLRKLLDLDRCYSVTRVPVDNGRTLCLYHVHLSAYTADGAIATRQLQLLLEDMAAEYAAGNYVVCGGDFNKDLLGNSAEIFGVSGEEQTWAQPFPEELLPSGLRLEAPLDASVPVPSCRNADRPYVPGESFVLTVDGFLVSENVEVLQTEVVDTGFAWSDHNPVVLTFALS